MAFNVKNLDVSKIVDQIKDAQRKFQSVVSDKALVEEARKYAEKQKKELTKLISADAHKVKAFLEGQRSELEKLQKQVPGEITKIKKYFASQKKELEKLLSNVKKTAKKSTAKKAPAKSTAKKATAKKAPAKSTAKKATAKKATSKATAKAATV